jgi:hypothetical protein
VPQVTLPLTVDGREETLSEYMCDWSDCPNIAVAVEGFIPSLRITSALCAEHAASSLDADPRSPGRCARSTARRRSRWAYCTVTSRNMMIRAMGGSPGRPVSRTSTLHAHPEEVCDDYCSWCRWIRHGYGGHTLFSAGEYGNQAGRCPCTSSTAASANRTGTD